MELSDLLLGELQLPLTGDVLAPHQLFGLARQTGPTPYSAEDRRSPPEALGPVGPNIPEVDIFPAALVNRL